MDYNVKQARDFLGCTTEQLWDLVALRWLRVYWTKKGKRRICYGNCDSLLDDHDGTLDYWERCLKEAKDCERKSYYWLEENNPVPTKEQ